MSIPKEPRQLMINLMYLVLTAMLALNVSAEIMNAFFKLDQGNQESMLIVKKQLDATEEGLKALLNGDNAEAKQKYKALEPAVMAVRKETSEFIDYVEKLRDELIDAGGNKNGERDEGDYMVKKGKKVPKGKKNKDLTTRLLVDQKKGAELKEKVLATKGKLIEILDKLLKDEGAKMDLKPEEMASKLKSFKENITLDIDDEGWKNSGKKSWQEHTFKQMPLAAVLPLLSQIQSNARSAEATLVNELAAMAGGKVIEFDKFFPVIAAKKAYIIKGEKFEADISVGTYSSQIKPSDIVLKVNGSSITPNAEGIGKYTATATQPGKKTLDLYCSVRNPLTDKVAEGRGTFEYEVGVRSASVAADKMNVFYIGVNNPITVSAAGVPSQQLKVSCSGAKMTGSGAKRTITATKPGKCVITLSGGGLPATKFDFRVKKIPNPSAYLTNGKMGGTIRPGTMRAQGGIMARLDESFQFDAKCSIQSYDLYYTPKRQDPIPILKQRGGKFAGKVKKAIAGAKVGDTYQFVGVKARCPGDQTGRPINPLSFTVK